MECLNENKPFAIRRFELFGRNAVENINRRDVFFFIPVNV